MINEFGIMFMIIGIFLLYMVIGFRVSLFLEKKFNMDIPSAVILPLGFTALITGLVMFLC